MESVPSTKTVKGLSIAVIVLSCLGLALSLFTFGLNAVITDLVIENSAQITSQIEQGSGISSLQNGHYSYSDGNINIDVNGADQQELDQLYDELKSEFGATSTDQAKVSMVASIISAVIGFLAACGCIGSIVALIAGIMGVRASSRSECLKAAFIWAVVGAVVSILTASLIAGILLIISAVYINKARNEAADQQPQPAAAPAQ